MNEPRKRPPHQPSRRRADRPAPPAQAQAAAPASDALVEAEDAFGAMIGAMERDADSGSVDLARPALALAADEYPGLNSQRYLDRLDDLADEALQAVVVSARSDCQAAHRLAVYLSEVKRMRGNESDYYDPRNSLLSDVLDRGLGIPITLSLVLIEVSRRLGVPMVGINFPGHFLVGCGPHRRNEYLLLDAFHGGRVVDWNECIARLDAMGLGFDPERHLAPLTGPEFFERLLSNLKAIYTRRGDVRRALCSIHRLTQIDPSHAGDYQHLAGALAAAGDYASARRSLRALLDEHPDCDEETTEAARETLSQLLELRASRN